MSIPDALRRLDDRILGDRLRGLSRRATSALGLALLLGACALVVVDHLADAELAAGAAVCALGAGTLLGRVAESEDRRRGRGLSDH